MLCMVGTRVHVEGDGEEKRDGARCTSEGLGDCVVMGGLD
jgi:hypothetical protein